MMKQSTSQLKWSTVLGVLLLAASAGAAVIWSDDFEGADKWPDKWTGGTGTAGFAANPDGSGNVLHIKSDTTADYAAARSQPIGTTLSTNTEFHVEFDVYFPSNAWMQTFRIFSAETSQIGPDITFRATEDHRTEPAFDYTVDVRENSGWTVLTSTGIPALTWTKIYLDASGDGTYAMHIGGYSNYIGTFDLMDGDWNRIYLGEGNGSSYSGEYYIDNMIITDTDIAPPPPPLFSDDFEGGDFAVKWPDVWMGGTGTAAVEANPDGTGNVLHLKSDTDADWAAARSQSIGTTLNQTNEFHVEFDVYFPLVSTMATHHLFSGETTTIGPDLVFRWTETHTTGEDYTFDVQEDAGYQELTTSTIAATTWTKVYIDAFGDGNYDVHVGSYSNNIGTFDLRDGDWSRINLGEGNGSSYSGEFYMDNIVIRDTAQAAPLPEGYAKWAGEWVFDIGSETNDYDSDGLINVHEYGLGGDPTNEFDQGTSPVLEIVDIGGSNVLSYVHPQLSDPNSGLVYSLELKDNLVIGGWTNSGYMVSGTNVPGGDLDFVTNVTDTVEDEKFIRLIIE